MKWFAISVLSLLVATSAPANDAEIAKQLEELGGKVVIKDGHVSQVVFTDCSKLMAPEFKAIGQLSKLKTLTLYGKCHGLNDISIGYLAGLTKLETLGTDGAQLSDAGLQQLTTLKSLKTLSFFHLSFRMEGFSGKGFRHLKDCEQLENLTVAGMSMGDDGFAAIAEIKQLKQLSTWHTYQTEIGNEHIAKLPNLKMLKVGQRLPRPGVKAASLSDASVPTFAKIQSLESLKLGEAHFTREALRELKSLPKLKQLTLFETDLPEAEVVQLRADLPNITIDFQPLTTDQRKKLEMYLKP